MVGDFFSMKPNGNYKPQCTNYFGINSNPFLYKHKTTKKLRGIFTLEAFCLSLNHVKSMVAWNTI